MAASTKSVDRVHFEFEARAPSRRRQPSGKPRNLAEAVIKRLAEELERARRLYEFGEHGWDTFSARRDEIQDQHRQLAEAGRTESVDVDCCQAQLLDLVAAWEAADPGQRSRLVAGIFEQLEAEALPEGRIRVVAVPRPAWRPFFKCLVVERETGVEPATSTLGRSRSAS
jgi:hypothetical protein